LPCR